MQITTYQSGKADVSKRWLAHMNLGGDIYMSFFGPSEQIAMDKANSWYEAEKARQDRLCKPSEDHYKGTTLAEKPSMQGRGHHFSGKLWVINRSTHHLCRIEPQELQSYEANGYVRGGPRSK